MMRSVRFSRFGIVFAMAAAGFMHSRAEAFVIANGDGNVNTTEASVNAFDPTFPYYRNAGVIFNLTPFAYATGVYLGGGWAMTAAHVGAFDLTVINSGGSPQTLTAISGSTVTIAPDLIMYRVSGDPGLPTLPIRSTPLTLGQNVIAIGNGIDRSTQQKYWRVDFGTNPDTWEAPTTSFVAPTAPWDAVATGFTSGGNQNKRWGSNLVEQININGAPTLPTLFGTFFDDPTTSATTGFLGTTYENEGAFGDSGGPAFVKNGSVWELAGITHSVGGFDGQPNAANNQVYGNETFYSDLFQYRSTILATIPEPASASLLLAGAALVFRRSRRRA